MQTEPNTYKSPSDTMTQQAVPFLRSPMPDVPGHEMLELVGRGGMGKVYRARQTALGRIVAVKLLVSEPDEKSLSRFREEYRAVARLQHPNIAQLFESGLAEGRPFFTQEFIEGGTLANKYGGVPQDAQEAARTVETIARAIHYSHEQGILHRDLKPHNILLTGRGEPKVTDFGLAKDLAASGGDTPQDSGGGLTRTGEILGTPSYMPPEQASGVVSGIDARADVYSLGAILYEALTGRPPFQGPDPLQTLFMVLSMEPVAPRTLLPKLPRDVETICLKCLEKSPKKRYATAAELADDLKRFLNREPIHARPVGRVEGLLKWAGRNKAAAALISLSAVFVVALIAFSIVEVVQSNRIKHANEQLGISNKNLIAAKVDLEQSNEGLVKAKKESDQSFTLAKSSLDEIIRRVGLRLYGIPLAEGVMLDAHANSADFYRRLAQIRPDDAATLEGFAEALFMYAINLEAYSRRNDAAKVRAELHELLRVQLVRYPDNVRLNAVRVRNLYEALLVAGKGDNVAEIRAAREAFINASGEFVKRWPDDKEARSFAVDHHAAKAMLAGAANGYADRVAHYRDALEVAEGWYKAEPETPSSFIKLTTILYQLGASEELRKDFAEADAHYERAEKLHKANWKKTGSKFAQADWAFAVMCRGDIAVKRGFGDDGLRYYKEVEPTLRELIALFPLDPQRKYDLAENLSKQAYVVFNDDNNAGRKLMDEVVQLIEELAKAHPMNYQYTTQRDKWVIWRKQMEPKKD